MDDATRQFADHCNSILGQVRQPQPRDGATLTPEEIIYVTVYDMLAVLLRARLEAGTVHAYMTTATAEQVDFDTVTGLMHDRGVPMPSFYRQKDAPNVFPDVGLEGPEYEDGVVYLMPDIPPIVRVWGMLNPVEVRIF